MLEFTDVTAVLQAAYEQQEEINRQAPVQCPYQVGDSVYPHGMETLFQVVYIWYVPSTCGHWRLHVESPDGAKIKANVSYFRTSKYEIGVFFRHSSDSDVFLYSDTEGEAQALIASTMNACSTSGAWGWLKMPHFVVERVEVNGKIVLQFGEDGAIAQKVQPFVM